MVGGGTERGGAYCRLVLKAGGGGALWIATGAAACIGTGGGGAPSTCWMMPLAAGVPSAPHAGHFITYGIRPPTGSTSKAYFWPQAQRIFNGTTFENIRRYWSASAGGMVLTSTRAVKLPTILSPRK